MPPEDSTRLLFAVHAGDEEEFRHALVLAESVRAFAGGLADSPVWIYAPPGLAATPAGLPARAAALGVEMHGSEAPRAARAYPFAGKVFAAARAEAAAAEQADLLAWMDEDTVVLREPRALALPAGVDLGYRPVMHRRIGSPYDEPADAFWARVYERLAVPESSVFPVVAPADGAKLRAYFNAGLLVVRPGRGILERWSRAFSALCGDETLAAMCREDRDRALFLHQAALAGAVLASVPRTQMNELPPTYNFPLFFKEQYGALREFDSIDGVVTLRYDVYFRNPAPDWSKRLKGPAEAVAWLKDRLGTV